MNTDKWKSYEEAYDHGYDDGTAASDITTANEFMAAEDAYDKGYMKGYSEGVEDHDQVTRKLWDQLKDFYHHCQEHHRLPNVCCPNVEML